MSFIKIQSQVHLVDSHRHIDILAAILCLNNKHIIIIFCRSFVSHKINFADEEKHLYCVQYILRNVVVKTLVYNINSHQRFFFLHFFDKI